MIAPPKWKKKKNTPKVKGNDFDANDEMISSSIQKIWRPAGIWAKPNKLSIWAPESSRYNDLNIVQQVFDKFISNGARGWEAWHKSRGYKHCDVEINQEN